MGRLNKSFLLLALALVLTLSLFLPFLSATSVTISQTPVGVIRGEYGVNNGANFFSNGTDYTNNYTIHQNLYSASGMKYIRADMSLDNLNIVNTSGDFNANYVYKRDNGLVNWSRNNNYTVIWIASYMPPWMANTTDVDALCSTSNKTCPPTNYTAWGNLVVNFLSAVGCDETVCKVEVWNEPDTQTTMLKDLSTSNANATLRSIYYNRIFNATYQAIKANNSKMEVMGGSWLSPNFAGTVIQNNFIGNFSYLGDNLSISTHKYLAVNNYPDNYDVVLQTRMNNIFNNCTALGATCNHVYITEGNIDNITVLSNPSTGLYGQELATGYTYLLNNHPNVNFIVYNWARTAYQMYNESSNLTYPSYDITKMFALNHKAGNTVLTSSSSDSGVKVVASNDSSHTFITLVNTNSSQQNVTLNLPASVTGDIVFDVNNPNTFYPIQNGQVSVSLNSNDVLTLENWQMITQVSPVGNITTQNYTQSISYNISTPSQLQNLTFNWNGANYSLYDPSLVLFFNMDNRSSLGENDTTIKDLSMYGNNGTVIGGSNISWTQNGKYGGAFNFSGNVGTINVSSLASLNYTNNLTYLIWAKFNKLDGSTTHTIFSDNVASPNKNWVIDVFGNVIEYTYFNSSGTTFTAQSTATIINTNQWYQIGVVVDRIGKTVSFYNNGTFLNTVTLNSTIAAVGSVRNFQIGGSRDGTTNRLNGTLDNAMLFNRSLTASEFSNLYNINQIKYDSQNWSVSANESISTTILNSTNPSQTYIYSLSVSNSTTSQVSNAQITRIPLTSSLSSLFSSKIGIINSNFYGANIQRLSFDSYTTNVLRIDTSTSSSNSDADTNLTWHEQGWTDAGLNQIREMIKLNGIYSNSSDGSLNMTGNITKVVNEIKWAYQNNKRVLLNIHNRVPTFLANVSSMCATDNASCPPNNFTYWNSMVVDIINKSTSNGLYLSAVDLEYGNEPEGTNFLAGLTTDNITKSLYFNQIYNSTYNAVKTAYPTMKVGGYGVILNVGANSNIAYTNMLNGFLSNFSNQMDFLSGHIYSSDVSSFVKQGILKNVLVNVYGNCSTYGTGCTNLYIDEWNNGNPYIQNSTITSNYSSDIAYFYMTLLNNYPASIRSSIFQWAEAYKYANSANYPEYPKKWAMVSEPQLDNAYYPPYNITRSFSQYCPPGSDVYVSGANDSQDGVVGSSVLQTVSCKVGNKYNLIVVNTGSEAVNASAYVNSLITTFTDQNGIFYSSNTNTKELGIIDSYDIKYLSFTTYVPAETTVTCNNFLGAGQSYFSFIVIAIIVGVAAFILVLFLGGDSESIDLNALTGVIVVSAVIFVIGMIIISNINSCS